MNVPPDFDTRLEVRVVATPEGGDSMHAFAIAFGGWAHACFAYVFTTTATGRGAETALGDRLAVMTRARLRASRWTIPDTPSSEVDPRAPRRSPAPP